MQPQLNQVENKYQELASKGNTPPTRKPFRKVKNVDKDETRDSEVEKLGTEEIGAHPTWQSQSAWRSRILERHGQAIGLGVKSVATVFRHM